MIDDKKFTEAAIQNADKYNPCRSTLDRKDVCRASFEDGAKWFKQAIWHDANEEPKFNRRLITQHITLMGELGYDLTTNIPAYSWELYVKGTHITKWCYIEDILSEGGEK